MWSIPRQTRSTSVPDQDDISINRHSSCAVRPVNDGLIESRDATGHVILSTGDKELDDLFFSWQRLTDPKLRKIALQVIRSMAA